MKLMMKKLEHVWKRKFRFINTTSQHWTNARNLERSSVGFFLCFNTSGLKMISSYFIEVIGGLYEIGEIITIKTAKASTKREIKIIDQSYNKVEKQI
jgi:hypothetical protein